MVHFEPQNDTITSGWKEFVLHDVPYTNIYFGLEGVGAKHGMKTPVRRTVDQVELIEVPVEAEHDVVVFPDHAHPTSFRR